MNGVDARTGKRLSGVDHLRQSIADILMTSIGTRTARRDYGSMLFELLGRPMNRLGKARLFAATATALARWEPRIRLTRVRLLSDAEALAAFADDPDFRGATGGQFALMLEGVSTEEPAPNQLLQLAIPLNFPLPA